jgi:L-glyceraldehyde 3-phosphate reductase
VLRQPQVTSVLIGASSIAQIEENVAALKDLSFSSAELKAIDALAPA